MITTVVTPGSAYFLAKENPDGSPGQPIGDEGTGAIMMWDSTRTVQDAREFLERENGPLSLFKVNLVFAGKVID